MAEFEPMGGVLIAYPGTVSPPPKHEQLPKRSPRAFGIPNDLIVRMQQKGTVHIFIMCDDASERDNVIKNLSDTAHAEDLSFDPDLIHFVPWDTDTYWTRDYGPWWVQKQSKKDNREDDGTEWDCAVAKHIYTTLGGGSVGRVEDDIMGKPTGSGPQDPPTAGGLFRPNDDYGAVKFSDYLNRPILNWNFAKQKPAIPIHEWFFTGLLDVGGNYMVNGEDVIASSYLVADQNEIPGEDSFNDRMEYIMDQTNRFLGAEKHMVLVDPSGTYIGHIDCRGKFLAPHKVLIAKSENAEVEKGYDRIADFFKDHGFEVFRALCQSVYIPGQDPAYQPTTAAYTNSLILNDHVYVPIADPERYGKYNQDALAVYREAMPDHTIVGIVGKPEFPWLGTDALHCRTRGVPRAVVDNWLKSQFLL